jgi:hypothetical protein
MMNFRSFRPIRVGRVKFCMWDVKNLTKPTPTAPNAGKCMLPGGAPASPGTRVELVPRPDAHGPVPERDFVNPAANSTVLLPVGLTLSEAYSARK